MNNEHIQQRLVDIDEKLHSIDKTLAVNTAHLAEHMRRSQLNEEAVAVLAEQIKPIQIHVANMQFLATAVAWVAGSGSVLAAIVWVLYKMAEKAFN